MHGLYRWRGFSTGLRFSVDSFPGLYSVSSCVALEGSLVLWTFQYSKESVLMSDQIIVSFFFKQYWRLRSFTLNYMTEDQPDAVQSRQGLILKNWLEINWSVKSWCLKAR